MVNEGMKVSQRGLNLVKEFEGLRLNAYVDPVGVWTIGYGHTKGVYSGMSITEAQANSFLEEDIRHHITGIFKYVTVQLNQNQFDALASFHFNLGAEILNGTDLCVYLNSQQWQNVANEMKLYRLGGGQILPGLVRRRAAEAALFLEAYVPPKPKLPPKNPAQAISKGINYETHVSKVGWMNNVKDGALSGSTGYKLPVEAIRIIGRLSNGSVEYRAHVSTIGWMPWVKSGQVAGTTGQSKAVEAIQARLTGDAVNYYNLEYQAHVAENGWLSWVKDGQTAGTTGQKKSLQAIKMKLVRKPIVQGTAKPVAKGLAYRMHLAKEGWLGYVTNNQMAGTTGLSIEGQCIEVYVDGKKENVKIDAHVAEKGWIENVGGTVGKQLSLQAVKISLKNGLEKQYNISYQVHVAEKGWMAWVENGAVAGTTGQKLAIQAIKIKLIAK